MAQALTVDDPRRIGPFEIVARVGEGAQGMVYLGRSPSGDQVAVKLLHARLSGDPDARTRFLREVSVALRVARFCTAPVLHADLEGNQPYIVSEYIPGPSLRELVQREGPRRGASLDRLAISTATALTAIHRAGILHRDFKPANVLMGPEGPVVIDFGIAKALDTPGTTATGDSLGTPSYMAPEQISSAVVTPAADMFAWGITMVFAATGSPAFGADTIPAVIQRILNEQPDLTALDAPLRDVVAACLSKDPARRPSAENVVAHLMGQKSAGANTGDQRSSENRQNGPTLQTGQTGANLSNNGNDRNGNVVNVGNDEHIVTHANSAKGKPRLAVTLTVSAVVASAILTAGTVALMRLSDASPSGSTPVTQQAHAVDAPGSGQTPDDGQTPEGRPSDGQADGSSPEPGSPDKTSAAKEPNGTSTSADTPATPTSPSTSAGTAQRSASPSQPPSSSAPPAPAPTSAPTTTSPKPNPYTAAQVCGSGYKVIDSHSLGSATIYLLYSSGSGKNCVVTMSKYVITQKIKMSAVLQVQGGSTSSDSGNYTTYAGPLRLPAAGKCVIWGGGYSTSDWKSGWSHCG
jgi:serine/threonine protein kinase